VTPIAVIASVTSAVAVGAIAFALVPPTPRLAGRVRPYGIARGDAAVAAARGGHAPLRVRAARALSSIGERTSDEHLLLRLRHARMFEALPLDRRVDAFRARTLATALALTIAGVALPLATGHGLGLGLVAGALGLVAGATRGRARLDRAVTARCERMRIELYSLDQLLAMHVRVGGGVAQAVGRIVARGEGEVVADLTDVLRAHEGGMTIADALERAASLSPEPHAARTYRLLASGARWGADLATGLLDLAEDIRDERREAIRRRATRRRAAMLVPIVGVLAPVMLLFVAAPIPSIVFGAR